MPENKEDLLRGVVHRVNAEDRSGSWMGARECLCVATDQEQHQITAGEFITANKPVGFGCTGVRFRDELALQR